MFGFPLLRGLSTLPLAQITLDEFMENFMYGKKQSVDLTDAKLLDVYPYIVNGIQYEQKVYRLKDGSLYTETKQNTEASVETLKKELAKLIEKQEFEKAAIVRDKLKSLK